MSTKRQDREPGAAMIGTAAGLDAAAAPRGRLRTAVDRWKKRSAGSPWAWLTAAIAGAAIVTTGFRRVFPLDEWAGLGQWVGGVGALIAAGAALRIAKGETDRERAREAGEARAQAYYVSAKWATTAPLGGLPFIEVVNKGSRPVQNLRAWRLCPFDPSRPTLELSAGIVPVLLPDKPELLRWAAAPPVDEGILRSYYVGTDKSAVEIVYDDLALTRWHRTGNEPPAPFAI